MNGQKPKPRKGSSKRYINILVLGDGGEFRTRRAEAIKEVAPGAFLMKSQGKKGYVVTDAITGLMIGSPRYTQAETIEAFEKFGRKTWEKMKKEKSGPFGDGYAVNEETKYGWNPVEPVFPKMVNRRYEKDKPGEKYSRTGMTITPYRSEKHLQRELAKKASNRTGMQTIRKVYGTEKEGKTTITKIVEYSKGYKLQKNSTFRPGKRTKGERLLSKTFLK